MKLPLLIIRHVDYVRLGSIPELLDELDIPYTTISLAEGDDFPESDQISGVISMGGPMSAYDTDNYPWIQDEMNFDQRVVKDGLPFLGICLGAQILSQAFGAQVKKSQNVEVGWFPLQKLPTIEKDELFLGLDVPELFQFHYDVFDVPNNAQCLLKSESSPHQAYRLCKKVYAFQFHPEMNQEMLHSVIDEYQDVLTLDQIEEIQITSDKKTQEGRIFLKEILRRLFGS